MTPSPRRILAVNKFFHPNAGAETVFFLERDLLRQRGHEILDFAMASEQNLASPFAQYFAPERRYEGVSKVIAARDAAASVYSVAARRRFTRLLRDAKPDVIHLHNIYHQLTLSLVDAAVAEGIPTVLTLHDYKIGCPSYDLYRDGRVCHDCVGSSPIGVVRHRCVKGSRLGSAVAFAEALLSRARDSYARIDMLVAPSAFVGDIAVQAGFDASRVMTVPNFLPEEEFVSAPPADASGRPAVFVFAGRLEPVKGIRETARLFADGRVPGTLRILGDGPLRTELEALASGSDAIEFVGRVPRDDVRAAYATARGALFPSLWEENCPMSLLEARAAGAAVICSAHGGLPSFVTDGVDGVLAAPGNDDEWVWALTEIGERPEYARELADAGLERLKRDHAPDPHYAALIDVYRQAMDRKR